MSPLMTQLHGKSVEVPGMPGIGGVLVIGKKVGLPAFASEVAAGVSHRLGSRLSRAGGSPRW